DLGIIALTNSISDLNQVTVTAKKPFIEQKIDRVVINIKNSITSAGGTVLDVLQKSPGVVVNRQSATINMSGKAGVQVMINGRLSYVPANALISMLEGINSNNVERIELITTPPSKFDAGGNAGYINIVMAPNADEGFNGSYSLTAAGFNGSAPAANADFNYRKKKINLYGGYSFSRRAQMQYVDNNRDVLYESKSIETTIYSIRDPYQLNHGIRIGMDYQLSKNTTLGFLASGYNNKFAMDANNTSVTKINRVENANIAITNDEVNQWKHGMLNLNLQHILKSGADLSLNIDYLKYDNFNPVKYVNSYFESDQLSKVDNLGSSKRTVIDILPIQLDYNKKLNDKTTIEGGAKMVISKFTNDVLVEQLLQNVWTPDTEFTANYKLNENVAAAHSSMSYNMNPKNTLKVGLRYEYTTSNLGSEKQANIVDRKYGYLFPTTYWSHKFNDNHSVNFTYNKRINRPTFNNLAPFLIFSDPNTFISGNSALQPAIANNLGINYSLKTLNFSLNYGHEKFTIGDFQFKVNPETNKQYNTAENLKYTESVNATFSIPTKITNWWNSQININSSWNHAVADYLTPTVSVKIFNYNLSGFQSFTVSKNVSMELSGFYQSKSLFGIAVMKSFGQINLGTQFKMPKSNSDLKLGVDDIFSTMKFNFENISEALGYNAYINLNMQRRLFKITYSKNFGNTILKAKRARATASDAERKRVSN
ncbi:MAG: outer membrane beta-barrel protein, partial [Bacteroidota bacterium]